MIKKNNKIVLRKVGDIYFLIDPTKSYNDENEDIFQTDEIGALIWKSISDETNLNKIVSNFVLFLTEKITNELLTQIKLDIQMFLEQLKVNGFVTEI